MVDYQFEIVDTIGTWSVMEQAFKYMCSTEQVNYKPEDWDKGCECEIVKPDGQTIHPIKQALGELVMDWVKTFPEKGWILVSIHPKNNIDDRGNYTKEYRNRYIYPDTATVRDILNVENYIAAFIAY